MNHTLVFNETGNNFFLKLKNLVNNNNNVIMLVLHKQIRSTTQLCSNLTIIGSLISWERIEKHYFPKEIMTDEREVIVLYTINELEPCRTYTAVIMISTSLIEKTDNVTFSKFMYILLLNKCFF